MSRKRNKNEKRTELAKVIFILPHRKNVFSAQAQCVLLCQRVCVCVCRCVPVVCCAILIIESPRCAPLRLSALLYIYFRFIVMSSKKIAQLPSPLYFPLPSPCLPCTTASVPVEFLGLLCDTHAFGMQFAFEACQDMDVAAALRSRPGLNSSLLLARAGHGLRLSCAHCTGLCGPPFTVLAPSPATWPY